jgi:hypothetical protein
MSDREYTWRGVSLDLASRAPRVAVIVPTIPDRDGLLRSTRAAYLASEGVECVFVVVRGSPTIGAGWREGLETVLRLEDVTHVNLSADDVEPAPEAIASACRAANAGYYPSPRILNPDGTLHSCGTLGAGMLLPECPTGSPAGSSPFPMFTIECARELPPIPSIHYYADDWLGFHARRLGLDCIVSRDYELLHLEGVVGRRRVQERAMTDRATALRSIGSYFERAERAEASPETILSES